MYADQVAAGSKRSIKDRLDGDLDRNHRPSSSSSKRQRQNDNKWKRDLYDDDIEPQTSKLKVGPRDLRLQLQKKSIHQTFQGGRDSGVRDLREKLSGAMHSQPPNIDLPKASSESTKTVKKTAPSAQAPLPESKKILNPTSSKMKTLHKPYSSVDGLLQSLGLQKYLITFQAEEVDMTALMHMTDDDLKALGIPMGPRKKILLALES
ncbi:ankyrin repeat and SAM domain-containing protein 6-like isoform X2 [Iris pallida]|uniref:Ankyrin repeat and SAM domain-containing protein 6-like isoform X2 n=2 Tax=Iris pallida TaxID=29817 RepID=A0AAX6DFB6_IRIPA|nr:ankyrin repeat and SAM domain-containing protein 6-like isoform X2 [Iris pallida]KAJ6801440.1 ankyrin repeat and SAM domain-containing protein 6-like isoform X2 [Iris pallida]